jgi:2'-5' RNA ligase
MKESAYNDTNLGVISKSEVVFNFGLLFEEGFSNEMVAVSEAFSACANLDYKLGEKSLPHVTILQFPGTLSMAEEFWQQLLKIELPPLALYFHGLGIDRFRAWDVAWVRVKHCATLRDVQMNARNVLGDLDYVNGVGSLFEPHLTLASWKLGDSIPSFPLSQAVFNRTGVRGRYSLGVSGPAFQYERCLFIKES